MSDPGKTYRTKEEVDKYRETNDCLHHLEELILKHKIISEKELRDIEKEVNKEVSDALNEALSST